MGKSYTIVSPKLEGGGSFLRIRMLIDILSKENQVYVISNEIRDFNKDVEIINIKRLAHPYLNTVVFTVFAMVELLRLNGKINNNNVITFGIANSISVYPILYSKKSNFFLFIRGYEIKELVMKKRNAFFVFLVDKFSYLIIKKSDCIVNSNSLLDYLKFKYSKTDVKILKNNILTTRLKSVRKDKKRFNIGYFGRLSPEKNILQLLYSFIILRKSGFNNLRLHIVGDGKQFKDVSKIIKINNMSTSIITYGWKDNIKEVMEKIDLVVVNSKFEGCPNIILESLGFGVPCIGSDVPGIRDILRGEELLFSPKGIQDLSIKLIKIQSSDSFYNRTKLNCLEYSKNYRFDWEKELSHLLNI